MDVQVIFDTQKKKILKNFFNPHTVLERVLYNYQPGSIESRTTYLGELMKMHAFAVIINSQVNMKLPGSCSALVIVSLARLRDSEG